MQTGLSKKVDVEKKGLNKEENQEFNDVFSNLLRIRIQ